MRPRVMGPLAVVVAIGATAVLGALSQVPYQSDRGTGAIVRLAWRTRGVRVDECRKLTEEELAELPQHMRREEVCQGRLLPYRLTVALDDETVVDREVQPAGARRDRPLYVFQDLPVQPGRHHVSIVFQREESDAGENEADTPAVLTFDEEVDVADREISLITYDPDQRRLERR